MNLDLLQQHVDASHQTLRRTATAVLAAATLLGVVGCGSSRGLSVKTDYDPTADFSRYRTFAFVPGRILLPGNVRDTNNTVLGDRIRNSVTTQLEEKGLRQVSSVQDSDLLVTYTAGVRTRQEMESRAAGEPRPFGWWGRGFYGSGGWWGPAYREFWVQNYTEGTILMDLIDTRSRQLVWRAYVTDRLTKAPDADQVSRIAAKVFATYPPKSSQ
ncbi:MAG: DUF4136 domain-containing protein [Akkermansiaceae bacterium]|nr:DUF4136 domain-containing protein [Armatimonadota bacterium]